MMEIPLGKVPFGLHDAWQPLTTIAEHKGTGEPFPSALPDIAGCDFDAVKRFACKFRLGALKSVDLVMPGLDGKLYFIEFKDAKTDRIAGLRRKAFDSLVVFWLSFGKHMSMDEICANAEFVLVKPDSERKKAPSETFFDELRQGAESLLPIPKGSGSEPLELQLRELTVYGLYSQVRIVFASEFGMFWQDSIGSCNETDFVERIARPSILQRKVKEETAVKTNRPDDMPGLTMQRQEINKKRGPPPPRTRVLPEGSYRRAGDTCRNASSYCPTRPKPAPRSADRHSFPASA